jgi:phenylpyruvate tautomerase PptA (4-oxalocrotonate tautomerase family)
VKKAVEKLEKAISYIQCLRLVNEDDEKYRDWAISRISETITELTSKELGAPYEEINVKGEEVKRETGD